MTGEPPDAGRRPMGMRTRATALAAVVAFAMIVATVAVLAGRGGDQELVKLPIGPAGAAGVEDAASTTLARSSLAYPAFGNVEYRVEGRLPDLATTAPAYRLATSATPERVGALASALGLDGPVRSEEGAWLVRDGARELRVERLAGLPWYLGASCSDVAVSSDEAGVAVSCAASGVAGGAGSASSTATAVDATCKPGAEPCVEPAPLPAPVPVDSGTTPGQAPAPTTTIAGCRAGTAECAPLPPATGPAASPPSPPPPAPVGVPTTVVCPPDAGCSVAPPCPPGAECLGPARDPSARAPEKPPRPADLPSREDAERLAREAFTRLGTGLDGFAVEDGWVAWDARVEPRVGGLRVFGLGASLSIGPKGEVVRANGFLAEPERIGDYPLVGLERALERLRGNVGIGPRPLPAEVVTTHPPGDEPADLPAGAPEVGTDQAAGVDAVPPPATTVPPGADPAIGDCAEPTVICDPPPGVTIAPPPPGPVPEPPPVVRTITGAHLALLQVDAVLVPVYVFELDGGEETFPVPAVTDEWLELETSTTRD